MAAKVFWLALFLVASVPAIRAQSDRSDPLSTGAIARLGTTRFRSGEGALAVSFLPDNRTLVVTKSDGRLQYWESQSGRFLREHRISQEEITAAAPTADGRYVATRGMYWAALHDAQTGQEMFKNKLAEHIRGELIAVADNASAIALGGSVRPVHHLIDLASGVGVDWPMNMSTNALAFSPDGSLLACAAPGLVRVWKWKESKEPRYFTIAHNNVARKADIRSLRFSPDASLLAVGIENEAASLIDLGTGEESGRLAMPAGDGASWREIVFSPDGRLLATPASPRADGGVAVWEVASGKLVQRLKTLDGGTSSIAFSPDDRWLAAATGSSLISVWNVETGELLGRDLAGHQAPPDALRFFPEDERLASAGNGTTVRLWTLQSGALERVMKYARDPQSFAHEICALDVSPDGKRIATSSMDDAVRIWEAETGRELFRLPGHGPLNSRHALRFTSDSRRLVTWGEDMRVCAWDVQTGKALKEYALEPAGAEVVRTAKLPGAEVPRGRELGLRTGRFSDDASRLVVALKAMHVFDVDSGRELLKFEYPKLPILWHLAVSPDNEYALLVGFGYEYEVSPADGKQARKTIHRAELRQLSDGKLVGELDREDGGKSAAAFSPDSRRAAITVGESDPRVVVVKVPEMTEIARIDGLRELPHALEFSRSGKLLAVSHGDTSVVVYDVDKLRTRN